MNIAAALRTLSERGRWAYLFYALTVLAIAGSVISYKALSAGSIGVWVYLALALAVLMQGARLERQRPTPFRWLWVLLAGVAAAIALSGGLSSPYYPLVYLFWVAAPTWVEKKARLAWLGLGYLGVELALLVSQGVGTWREVPQHLVFALLFWGMHQIAFGSYLRWLRKEQVAQLQKQELDFVKDAQAFRLGAGPRGCEQGTQHGSVASLHGTIDFELDLLRESLGLHAALLLWPAASGWTIKAHRSGRALKLDEVLPASGFLAPLQKGERVLRVHGGVPERGRFYYQDATLEVKSLCCVALLDEGETGGVLVVDRLSGQPFSEAEVGILQRAGEHLMRCLAQERAFTQVQAQRQMHAQLHAASVRLSQALGSAQLQCSSLEALSMLLPCDLALLFAVQDEPGAAAKMSLVAQRANAPLSDQWQACIKDWSAASRTEASAGMVGSAKKNRVMVSPKRPEECAGGLCVFGGEQRVLGVGSMVALPMVHADQCDAVVVLLSRTPEAFSKQGLSSSAILVNQIGAAMQNARLYDQMQRQATTDGLTGLANHRTFQSRLDEAIAQVQRTPAPLSLILTDIDHFKRVNDSYGHPVGDEVLRGVARVLEEIARKNDLVARYGGEEFVLLLPGSDADAAATLAERLRQEVAALQFHSEQEAFEVTLSLGIAQWRGTRDARQSLVDRADKALYACKGAGRNCVTRYSELAQPPASLASIG